METSPSRCVRSMFFIYLLGSMLFLSLHWFTSDKILFPQGDASRDAPGNAESANGSSVEAPSISLAQSLPLNPFSHQKVDVNGNEISKDQAFYHLSHEFMIGKIFQGALQPTKILPYYFRANPAPSSIDISATTMITLERIPIFEYMVDNYQGPVSVTIYVPADPAKRDENFQQLKDLYNRNANVRKYVDAHVVTDFYPRQLNYWRNVARFFARTDYIFQIDVDFFICTDIRNSLLSRQDWLEPLASGHVAYVVPAFEYNKNYAHTKAPDFPKTKAGAVSEFESNKLIMFHNRWKRGHGPTNYVKWMDADDIYDISNYNFNYEPYVIIRKDKAPWCDERFVGYGSNKAACLYEVFLSGIQFKVLPNDFLIHQAHDYPEISRKIERRYNHRLYDYYREESCVKYKRQAAVQRLLKLSSVTGESPSVDNLNDQDMLSVYKKECALHKWM